MLIAPIPWPQSIKDDDAKALVALLHPQGKLFAAMQRADAEQLIRYIFPVERWVWNVCKSWC